MSDTTKFELLHPAFRLVEHKPTTWLLDEYEDGAAADFTDLDLSDIVGVGRAKVLLMVECTGGSSANKNFEARPKGVTAEQQTWGFVVGANFTTREVREIFTDDQGRIQYKSAAVTGANFKLAVYGYWAMGASK